MRRIMTVLGTGLLSVALSAAAAGAAPATKPTAGHMPRTTVTKTAKREWFAVAGAPRSEAAAKTLVNRLNAKGLSGYEIRMRSGRHEVERAFPDRRAAEQAATRLRKDGFRSRVARERA